MLCQSCRSPLRMDSSLSDLNPSAFDILVSTTTHSTPDKTSNGRMNANPRKEQYEQALCDANPDPVFKRSSVHDPKDIRDSTMSFMMVTQSELPRPPSANTLSQEISGKAAIPYPIERANNLFRVLSSQSDIDHPICVECADTLVTDLQKKLDTAMKERDSFIAFEKELIANESQYAKELASAKKTAPVVEKSCQDAREELIGLEGEKLALEKELVELERESRELTAATEDYWRERNQIDADLTQLQEEHESLTMRLSQNRWLLEKLQRTNVYNDTFCISHEAYYPTINGLRLGRSAKMPVDWPEINAALGLTLLLLDTVARKTSFRFDGYELQPLGSTSRIIRLQPVSSPVSSRLLGRTQASSVQPQQRQQQNPMKRNVLELFSSGDMPILLGFMHRRFDNALVALLDVAHQLGQHIERQMAGSDYMRIPLVIKDDTINNRSIRYTASNDETWTSACRSFLVYCKYLLAHASNVNMRAR